MLNSVNLVGRIKDSYVLDEDLFIEVECSRNYKELDGKIVSDFIKCKIVKDLFNCLGLRKDVLVSIVGRINSLKDKQTYIDVYDIERMN